MKNISKIYLLGDSWIEGQGCEPEPTLIHEELRKWRKETSWNKHFREKYNIIDSQIVNLGSQGSDNFGMFYQLNNILKNAFVAKKMISYFLNGISHNKLDLCLLCFF